MPAPIAFDLSALGMPDVERAVNGLEPKVAKRLVRSSLREGFKITFAAVKAAVPRYEGALARSLKLRSGGLTRGTMQMRIFTGDYKVLGYRLTKRFGRRGGHGRQGYAPAAIEFGYPIRQAPDKFAYTYRRRAGRMGELVTVTGTRRSRAVHGPQRVAPRSFMRAPFEATKDQVIAKVGADLRAGLLEELSKGGA